MRTPISPELSSTTHQKSLDTLYSPNIFAISDAGSDDELKSEKINIYIYYYYTIYYNLYYILATLMLNIVRNPQENLKSKKCSAYAKKQTRLVEHF